MGASRATLKLSPSFTKQLCLSMTSSTVKFNATLLPEHIKFLERLSLNGRLSKSTVLQFIIEDAIANQSRFNFLSREDCGDSDGGETSPRGRYREG